MDERQKEKIRFNTEIIKILAFLFVATGGGTISLIINQLPGSTDGFFAVTGMFFALLSGIIAMILGRDTYKLLKNE